MALVPYVEDEAATGIVRDLVSVVDFFNGSSAIASGLTVDYAAPVKAEE